MGDKAPQPVGHDRLVTVDTNYQLSTKYLEQNDRRLPEQQQAKAEVAHIKRAASPKCKQLFDAILANGGPGTADTRNSTAEAIGVDHTTLGRCYGEAQKVSDWKIFGEQKEPLSLDDPRRVFRNITSMATSVAKELQAAPVPMDVIQETSGMPAVALFEPDKRSSLGRNVPPDEWQEIKARLEREDEETEAANAAEPET